jgi:dipeptidyl aminopeptidase/acylaminoacyl peptidase
MRRLIPLVLALLAATPLAAQDYHRAEQFLTWNAMRLVYHDQVLPTWYRDSTRFFYRVHTRRGFEFMAVSPATGAKAQLFDNARLAAALSVAADTAIDPGKLPFPTIAFDQDGKDESALRLRIGKRGFRCELATYRCASADTLPDRTRFVRSPDDRWDAFVSSYDLWVRPAAGGDSIRLTTDGEKGYAYGEGAARPTQVRMKRAGRPTIIWSPDSKRLAVMRYDERGMTMFHLISSTTIPPTEYSYPYALPGDSIVGTSEWYLADVGRRAVTKVKADPQPTMSLYSFGGGPGEQLQWSAAGDRVYFTSVDRGPKRVQLLSADPATGETRVVLADSSQTYVIGMTDLLSAALGGGSNWRVLKNGDLVWFAERDGFAHFYLHGPDGAVKGQLTRGPWTVSQLLWVDEGAGRLYFTARGREAGRHPDYLGLYSVGLDGSGLALLSPENADHEIRAVPSGKYFVDAYSTVSEPPVIVLRGPDGKVVTELERADIADLLATGWKPGRVFTAKARDGVTDIWGVVYTPSPFDSTLKYPVIDHIYPGPLISPVSKDFFPNREPFTYSLAGQVQALAELGFVVLEIDALGNTSRAKALYTSWYGNMRDNGIPDHIAAIEQLAARMPSLDLNRVGIYGHSGGGFASTDALLSHPELFKVAVSTSGNHDNRTYYYGWGERFQGLLTRDTTAKTDNYAAAANKTYAAKLRGKLFLVHGDLDDNVHPANTISLVDALIKANKSFDFLIVPDANHDLTQNPYVIRRTWDYFVANLLGETPPVDYLITPPSP